MSTNLHISQSQITKFCQQHYIARLALFGSVLRDDFHPDSDVDVLVEFAEGHVPDFFRFVDMQDQLGEIFERQVDLHTPNSLSKYFRQEVLDLAQVVYEQAG
jgi:uncharacterized protein